jgi:phage head maturation protease
MTTTTDPPSPPQDELAAIPLEVRTVDEATRSATVRVIRYGETSTIARPEGERFVPAAFTRSVAARADRIPFATSHTEGTGILPRGATVARPTAWSTVGPDLLADLRFFDDENGWRAYWAAKDGRLAGGSVGFKTLEERTAADGAREIVVAELHHVMIGPGTVPGQVPAYGSTGLVEVRTSAANVAALLAVDWSHVDPDACVDPDELIRMGHLGG